MYVYTRSENGGTKGGRYKGWKSKVQFSLTTAWRKLETNPIRECSRDTVEMEALEMENGWIYEIKLGGRSTLDTKVKRDV